MLSPRYRLRGSYSVPFDPPFSLEGPYDPGRIFDETVLTQLHCHTNQSDGSHNPATIVADYLSAGYGALAITDHNKVTAQPAGITTAIPANELTSSLQHIITVGSNYASGSTNPQTLIDGALAAGGQAHVAHPGWSVGMTDGEMAALSGHLGFEIHNAHCMNGAGQNPVTYKPMAIDRWDAHWTAGRTPWGFSVDDLHTIGNYETWDIGRHHVFVPQNGVSGILASLVNGDFVADVSNHGVTPGYPARTVDGVSLTCAGATAIEAYGSGGALLDSASGTTLSYDYQGDEQYVRLVARGGYSEDFSGTIPQHWKTVSGTWTVTGGVMSQSTSTSAALKALRRHRQGDFTVQFDARTRAADKGFGLSFNLLNSSYMYLLNFGKAGAGSAYDGKAAVGVSNGAFAGILAGSAFSPTVDLWYRVVVDYTSAGRFRMRYWDRDFGSDPGTWAIDVTDTTWNYGAFGFRGYGPAEYDNLVIDGFHTYYQPISVVA